MRSYKELKRGDRVEIRRRSRTVHRGTVIRVLDANDKMMCGHELGTDLFITIDVDGLGPRLWRQWDERFRAKDLSRIGAVSLHREEARDDEA